MLSDVASRLTQDKFLTSTKTIEYKLNASRASTDYTSTCKPHDSWHFGCCGCCVSTDARKRRKRNRPYQQWLCWSAVVTNSPKESYLHWALCWLSVGWIYQKHSTHQSCINNNYHLSRLNRLREKKCDERQAKSQSKRSLPLHVQNYSQQVKTCWCEMACYDCTILNLGNGNTYVLSVM